MSVQSTMMVISVVFLTVFLWKWRVLRQTSSIFFKIITFRYHQQCNCECFSTTQNWSGEKQHLLVSRGVTCCTGAIATHNLSHTSKLFHWTDVKVVSMFSPGLLRYACLWPCKDIIQYYFRKTDPSKICIQEWMLEATDRVGNIERQANNFFVFFMGLNDGYTPAKHKKITI